MNNRNGEWCDDAVGWGKADSNGIEDGIHCKRDGKECMMKCKEKTDKSVHKRLSDEQILKLADNFQKLFDEKFNGVECDSAAVLRDYVRIRNENERLKDELKDAKMTCSQEKCPFQLDELRAVNDRLGKLMKDVKAKVESVDTDFDIMYYMEMMSGEDFESINALYEAVMSVKKLFVEEERKENEE